jgi:hypothetical protein
MVLLKKIIVLSAMLFYLYTLAFGIFLTDSLRIPAPVISGLILLPFVKVNVRSFAYLKETIFFTVGMFLYYVIGTGDYKTFVATLITCLICLFYFNYFIGLNKVRFNLSVIIFFSLLLISMIFMVLDHNYPDIIDPLRSTLLDGEVKQSPAGLSDTQFTFGYQIAAFTAFAFIFVCCFRQLFLVQAIVLGICLTIIYLGMNRSAFVSFTATIILFLIIYYRFKAVLLVAASIIVGFAVYSLVLKDNVDSKKNILSKNVAKQDIEINRADLASENLNVYADYPFGLIFYGKNWDEVTYKNPVFPFGLTSHNAYLMFITYLGPFLGFGLLFAVYHKIVRLFWLTIKHIRLKANALLLSLFFSFLAVSINALFHNAWLFTTDGPTLFLYFGILQGSKIYLVQGADEQTGDLAYVH